MLITDLYRDNQLLLCLFSFKACYSTAFAPRGKKRKFRKIIARLKDTTSYFSKDDLAIA